MKTNNQLWDFRLEFDSNFDEEVLAIHTSSLTNVSTTTTIVEGITSIINFGGKNNGRWGMEFLCK